MSVSDKIPDEIVEDMDRAVRLEWWNIGWTISIIVAMGLAMGSSQTMKTAWVEDTLGLIPPIVFLIAVRFEKKKPSLLFPFGFDRVHSFSFLIAAVALALVGATLLWDAGSSLYAREHATVTSVRLFGRDVWLGWIMLAAQIYSIIPPYLIARKELPLSKRLQDEVLHTDALMNKANWLTGAAGLFGIIGLGLGWWWADSTAAAIISVDIILDGWRALKIATAELVDGAPRGLGEAEMDAEARQLMKKLESRYPEASIRVRETGRYLHAEIRGARPGKEEDLSAFWPGEPGRRWRLVQVAFVTADDAALAAEKKPVRRKSRPAPGSPDKARRSRTKRGRREGSRSS